MREKFPQARDNAAVDQCLSSGRSFVPSESYLAWSLPFSAHSRASSVPLSTTRSKQSGSNGMSRASSTSRSTCTESDRCRAGGVQLRFEAKVAQLIPWAFERRTHGLRARLSHQVAILGALVDDPLPMGGRRLYSSTVDQSNSLRSGTAPQHAIFCGVLQRTAQPTHETRHSNATNVLQDLGTTTMRGASCERSECKNTALHASSPSFSRTQLLGLTRGRQQLCSALHNEHVTRPSRDTLTANIPPPYQASHSRALEWLPTASTSVVSRTTAVHDARRHAREAELF